MKTLCKPNITSAGTTSPMIAPWQAQTLLQESFLISRTRNLKLWDPRHRVALCVCFAEEAIKEKLASTIVTVSQEETKIIITER